jgi:hypothetical protein
MPMRNERAAPTFDGSNPRVLPRFFKDLETLMARAEITSEIEKKKQVLNYVDVDTEQMWNTFPEYLQPTLTYADFKAAILEQYPDATGDFLYSIKDMDLLIGERQRIGIASIIYAGPVRLSLAIHGHHPMAHQQTAPRRSRTGARLR